MRNLRELNINDGGAAPNRKAPDTETVEAFEEKFGLRIPDDLKSLLSVANGGHPELDAVGGVTGQYAVSRFYHLTSDDHGSESLWHAVEDWRPKLGKDALPSAFDGGNKQFFLDLSIDPPPVKLWIDDEVRAVYTAATFEKFIDALEWDPDMI